jgi:hypothetical protein
MKATLVGFVVLLLIAAVGFGAYHFLIQSKSQETTFTTQSLSKTGIIQKVIPPGDDYTYLLIARDETVKLNSQTVELSIYEGKKIQVTGQFSGSTLYVDAVKDESN